MNHSYGLFAGISTYNIYNHIYGTYTFIITNKLPKLQVTECWSLPDYWDGSSIRSTALRHWQTIRESWRLDVLSVASVMDSSDCRLTRWGWVKISVRKWMVMDGSILGRLDNIGKLTNIRSLQKLNCQSPFTIYCLIILDLSWSQAPKDAARVFTTWSQQWSETTWVNHNTHSNRIDDWLVVE